MKNKNKNFIILYFEVVGNRTTQDHFSKVSIYNFSGLKKYKKRVYRNDKKKLP